MTLLHCPELLELEFPMLCPTVAHRATVSSITSVNIQKITFSHTPATVIVVLQALMDCACWTPFDDCISALADELKRSGNGRTLEVEFQIDCAISDLPVTCSGFLPKFREKGRVRVVRRSIGQILELVCFLFFSLAPCYHP